MTISILDKSKIPALPESKRELEHHFAEHLDTLTYPLLARIYLAEGDLERTRKVCSIGLEHHPRHAPGLFLLALASLREGDLQDAESLLLKTLDRDQYHVEAAELLVAVQERLQRNKSVLEHAYQRLLKANPLSRAAQHRLDRIQAERELVKGVQDHLRKKRGEPVDSDDEALRVEEPRIVEPAEPAYEPPKTTEAKPPEQAEAPAAGEPIVGQPEVEIKAEVVDAAADTAAPGTLFYEESTAEQGPQEEILDIPATTPIIEEAPDRPVIEDIEAETGPAGEVIDVPEIVQEGEPLEPLQPAESSEPVDQPITAETKPEEPVPEEPDLDDEIARARAYWAELEPPLSETEGAITEESIAEDQDLEKASVLPGAEDVEDGDVGPLEEGDEKLVVAEPGELQAFEPGILTTPADESITAAASGDEDADTHPSWPGVPPVDRPDNWENELQELADQESQGLATTQGTLAEESTTEQSTAPAGAESPEDRDLERESFEPGEQPVPAGMKPEEVDLPDRTAGVEPHQPDVILNHQETEAEKALTAEDISEVQDTEEAGLLPGVGQVQENETEPPEKVESPTVDQPDEQAFEPGASYAKEDRPVDEAMAPVTHDDTAAEKLFEPGTPELTEEAEPEEDQDLSTGQAVEEIPGQSSITPAAEADGSAEVASETEKSEEDLFEPGTAAAPAEGRPEEEGLTEEVSGDIEIAAEPSLPGASPVSGPGPSEGVPESRAELEAKDLTIEQRPFTEESPVEQARTAAEEEPPQDRDLERESFEPGEKPIAADAEPEEADLQDRVASAEPHRPDVVIARRESDAEKAITTEYISEAKDAEETDILPGAGYVQEGEAESPEEVESPATDQPKDHMFEPGTDYAEKERPVDETEESAAAEAPFEPGTPEEFEETEPEEDQDLAMSPTVEEKPVPSPTAIAAEAEDSVGPAPETEKAEEDLFEPGTAAAEDEVDEEDITESVSGEEETAEESSWPDTSILSGPAPRVSAPGERAELEVRDLAEAQRPSPEEPTAEQAAAEGEADTTVTPEDKDLEREPFEPGEQPVAAEAEPEEAALEQPTPEERAEEEPYRPDVESLEQEAELESTVIDQAALDEGKMAGDSFEPSSVPPAEAAPEPIPETAPEPAELADEDFEFEAEFQAAKEAEDKAALGIDPKLATFTLATIYKVQGLYHQALQVLEAVATKGGDPERIIAERETILQLMASDTDIEPE